MHENYFEKNNYKILNIRVTYMRGMEMFHAGKACSRVAISDNETLCMKKK